MKARKTEYQFDVLKIKPLPVLIITILFRKIESIW